MLLLQSLTQRQFLPISKSSRCSFHHRTHLTSSAPATQPAHSPLLPLTALHVATLHMHRVATFEYETHRVITEHRHSCPHHKAYICSVLITANITHGHQDPNVLLKAAWFWISGFHKSFNSSAGNEQVPF